MGTSIVSKTGDLSARCRSGAYSQHTMSQKITGKNLSYDTALPPFLQALRSQTGGSDQPQTTGQRRAAKKRSDSEDAEDVPVVVDEDGNVVTVEVDKEGQVKPGEALDPTTVESAEKDGVKESKRMLRPPKLPLEVGNARSEGSSATLGALRNRTRNTGQRTRSSKMRRPKPRNPRKHKKSNSALMMKNERVPTLHWSTQRVSFISKHTHDQAWLAVSVMSTTDTDCRRPGSGSPAHIVTR